MRMQPFRRDLLRVLIVYYLRRPQSDHKGRPFATPKPRRSGARGVVDDWPLSRIAAPATNCFSLCRNLF